MTLYAIHYAWIDGHSAKAPVGLWGEGGVSHYLPETEGLRAAGSLAETEGSRMAWERWVEKRTEWGSSQGASWEGIESDKTMPELLAELRAEFFSQPHPPLKILIPDILAPGSKEDFGGAEEESEDEAPREPAERFVIAQSWWLASELVRRHPQLLVHEMHPGGGMYDVLALYTPPYDAGATQIMLNRAGTIQVHHISGDPHNDVLLGTWADLLAADDPHWMVKNIEDAARLRLAKKAPASTPRALSFRFISAALSATINDRHVWDARNEFIDSSSSYPGSAEVNGYLDAFPAVRDDLRTTPSIPGEWHEPESHYWAILRDQKPVAIVSIEGRVYCRDRRYDLARAYSEQNRQMLPLIITVLGDLLP